LNGHYTIYTHADFLSYSLKLKDEPVSFGFSSFSNKATMQYIIEDISPYTGRVNYPFLDDVYPDKIIAAESQSTTIKAPLEGVFIANKKINDFIHEREPIATINQIPILSPASGKIEGLLNSGMFIKAATVFCQINSANSPNAATIPEKYFSLAGGVLEALIYDINLNTTS